MGVVVVEAHLLEWVAVQELLSKALEEEMGLVQLPVTGEAEVVQER